MSNVKMMKAADVSDIHVNVPLSNMTVAYMQDTKDFIADKVFPVVPVSQISGRYFSFPKDSFLKNRAGKWTPGTKMHQTLFDVNNADTYSCQFRAIEYPMPWHFKAAADSQLQFEYAAMAHITQQLLLNREQEWATDFFAAGKWTTQPLAGTDFVAWDNFGTSNPIEDVLTYKDTVFGLTAKMPNTLVLPYNVYTQLRLHPLIKEMYKFYQFPDVNESALAKIFDVDKVLIARALSMNTADGSGDPLTVSNVYGKNAWLGYVPDAPGLMSPASGYIFSWNAMTAGFQIAVEKIPDQRDKVDYLQAVMSYDQKLIGADLGCFFRSVMT